MGFKINTNVDALKAYEMLGRANKMTAKAQLKMASGQNISSVSDDTSGFNIGSSLKGKVTVMKGSQQNISAAKNLLSTAEGAMLSINDLLVKIEGKLSDASNPTGDRTSLKDDIIALANEITSILNNTKFNDTRLLTESESNAGFIFQVGESGDTLKLDFASTLASTKEGSTGVATGTGGMSTATANRVTSFTGVTAAQLASTSVVSSLNSTIKSFKSDVVSALGKLGNFGQRLDIKEETLNVAIANAESSISRIFDTDMAMEQLNATKGSILQQAATAMFAQLNMAPQQVLQLFG